MTDNEKFIIKGWIIVTSIIVMSMWLIVIGDNVHRIIAGCILSFALLQAHRTVVKLS